MLSSISFLGTLLLLSPILLAGSFLLGRWLVQHKHSAQTTALQLLSEVFDTTHDGVTITNTKGEIVSVNRTFTQVTGYSPAEVIGQNPRILSSGRHDQAFYKEYWQALQNKGMWQGEIWNKRKDGAIYLEWLTCKAVKNNLGEITHYVAVFSDITEARRQEIRLEHATQHDKLTGLPNTGTLLRDLAAHPPKQDTYWCMILLDINNFKLVNSSYGFKVGDQLLNSIARRLQDCCPQGKLARHSADVFIMALPFSPLGKEPEQQVDQIKLCISRPFTVLGKLMEFNFSIGATLWLDANLTTADVLQEAELALHASKNKGVGLTRFFSEELKTNQNPLAYLQGLREALVNDELQLYFQPLITAATGTINAVEVLLRWQHPSLGQISPDQFIPLAEKHGLMEALGNWVLKQALKTYSLWLEQDIAPPKIAVNVSPLEFESENFVNQVLNALKNTGVAPSHLELELTEGVLVEQNPNTLTKLNQLSEAGISLAIDDFGTGYSSLAYLKHLPVNKLKLDRAFIQELPHNEADRAIVESTLALCRGLKMSVVAEGVENSEQADYLRRKGCDYLQGYHFGRPQNFQITNALLKSKPNSLYGAGV